MDRKHDSRFDSLIGAADALARIAHEIREAALAARTVAETNVPEASDRVARYMIEELHTAEASMLADDVRRYAELLLVRFDVEVTR